MISAAYNVSTDTRQSTQMPYLVLIGNRSRGEHWPTSPDRISALRYDPIQPSGFGGFKQSEPSKNTPRGNTMAKRVKPRANTRHIAGMLQLASVSDIAEGIEWYDRAYRLAVQFIHAYDGLTLGQAIGVIAALSPNNKWARNCQDAERMIKLWHNGQDPRLAKVCTYNNNKDKAAKILESVDTEAIESILGGRKVVAFYRSISGYKDSVCVDGHAYAVFIGERIPTTKTPKLSAGLYDAIARSYCLVAERSVELCGHKLTPAQVQAVTWVTYRRLCDVK